MKEDEYLVERVDDQIDWYDRKSQTNQKFFKILRLLEIITASLIPLLSGVSDKVTWFPWLIGALGVLIVVSASISEIFKYHENWIEYRTTAEQLKHEKYSYLTNSEPYNNEDRFDILVKRVESLISKENSAWAAITRKKSNVVKRT